MGSKVKRAKCPVPRKVRNRAFFVWFVCDISSPCAEFAVISRRDVWKVFSWRVKLSACTHMAVSSIPAIAVW